MSKQKMLSKQEVLREMMHLACHPVNDAVRLAYLSEEEQEEISKLDLSGLSEFKRNANGTLELKFTDRLGVLQSLLDRLETEEEEGVGALAFLQALEQPETTDSVSRR